MHALSQAFSSIFDPTILFMVFCGVSGGMAVGAIPGLTATMAVAVMTSFTFHMEPLQAIMILLGVYFGGISPEPPPP